MSAYCFYPITFTFRQKECIALVQDYGSGHWSVNFGHEEIAIVQDFSRTIVFSPTEIRCDRRPHDWKDLEVAIRKAVKERSS